MTSNPPRSMIDPNADHRAAIAALTPTTDLNGRTIAAGSLVRSFDFPFLFEDGRVAGLDLDGERTCYIEGTVIAIGEDHAEGCPRYRIRVHKQVYFCSEAGALTERSGEDGWEILPPLNGTPIWGRDYGCFGVVVVD